MTARAFVVDAWQFGDQVAIGIALQVGELSAQVMDFSQVMVTNLEPAVQSPDDTMLRISTDAARALYEALARHFGGIGVDVTALRRDYDHERGRVDRFIDALLTEVGQP